jgi:hypothetical protein
MVTVGTVPFPLFTGAVGLLLTLRTVLYIHLNHLLSLVLDIKKPGTGQVN